MTQQGPGGFDAMIHTQLGETEIRYSDKIKGHKHYWVELRMMPCIGAKEPDNRDDQLVWFICTMMLIIHTCLGVKAESASISARAQNIRREL